MSATASGSSKFRYVIHLLSRFVGSFDPRPLSDGDVAWLESNLTGGETRLWRSMSTSDRRHSIAVTRRVDLALGPATDASVLAAAALHDVGKVVCGYGVIRRSLATVAVAVFGREQVLSRTGDEKSRWVRLNHYLRHPELGAELLTDSGAGAIAVTWAREHHGPPERMSLPVGVWTALKNADDD